MRSIATAKRRGLDVEAILDKSQDRHSSTRSRYSGAIYLANAGVPVWIDDAPAIAHSKIIILDDHTVLTGSFDFTKSADTRNAENVVVIDSQTVAAWFTQNLEDRKAASRVGGEQMTAFPGWQLAEPTVIKAVLHLRIAPKRSVLRIKPWGMKLIIRRLTWSDRI